MANPIAKWTARLTLGIASLAMVATGLFYAARVTFCSTDIAERVEIPNSNWIVVTEVFRCGLTDGGAMKIVALDRLTGKRSILFAFDTEYDSRMTLTPKGIVVLVPDYVVTLSQQVNRLGDLDVSLKRIPESSLIRPPISN